MIWLWVYLGGYAFDIIWMGVQVGRDPEYSGKDKAPVRLLLLGIGMVLAVIWPITTIWTFSRWVGEKSRRKKR